MGFTIRKEDWEKFGESYRQQMRAQGLCFDGKQCKDEDCVVHWEDDEGEEDEDEEDEDEDWDVEWVEPVTKARVAAKGGTKANSRPRHRHGLRWSFTSVLMLTFGLATTLAILLV